MKRPTRTPTAATPSSRYRNLHEKAEEINLVLLQPTVDLWKLRDLALSDGGLVNDTLRKRAWPKLVGLQKYEQQQQQHHQQPPPMRRQDDTKQRCKSSTFPAVGEEGPALSFSSGDQQPQQQLKQRTLESTEIDENDPEQAKIEIDTASMNMPPATASLSLSSSSATATTAMTSPSSSSLMIHSSSPLPPPAMFSTSSSSWYYSDLLVQCMDVEQIERDVSRCTWHLLTGSQRSRRNQIKRKDQSKKVGLLLKRKQRRLANLINLTLVESYAMNRQQQQQQQLDEKEDRLRYYQGYHDVACIFMHALGGGQSTPHGLAATPLLSLQHQPQDIMGLDLAAKVLCQVSFSHFRDNLRSNFVSLQAALKICLYPLLRILDPVVHDHLLDCDMEPFFCLSWILTWFSHDVRDTTLCKRLFDAFLASHPLLVLYVSLAMMLHPYNRQLILQTDCDFATLHQCLASLPKNSCKVGWKKQRGGGYVSDENNDNRTQADEEEDDDDDYDDDNTYFDDETASTDMDMSSVLLPPSVQTAPSMTSRGTGNSSANNNIHHNLGPTTIEEGTEQRVPFQMLIDTALGYMARYPPRCLEEIARRYYAWQEQQQQQGQRGVGLAMSQPPTASVSNAGISLLQDPPSWSLVSAATADWVLKQRLRQDLGLKATSRKDRRKKAQAARPPLTAREEEALQELRLLDDSSSLASSPDLDYLKRHATDRAVIAAGYGPGPEAVLERKRRRQRLAMAVAVGFLAMSVSLALQYYYDRSNSSPEKLLLGPSSSQSLSEELLQRANVSSSSSTAIVAISSTTSVETALPAAAAAAGDSGGVANAVTDYCKLPVAYMFQQSLPAAGPSSSTESEDGGGDDDDSKKISLPSKSVNQEGNRDVAPHSTGSITRPKTLVKDTSSTPLAAPENTAKMVTDKKPNPSHSGARLTLDHPNAGALHHQHHDGRHWLTTTGGHLERVSLKLVRFLLQPLRLVLGKMNLQTPKGQVVLGNLRMWLDQGMHLD